jgi:N-acyl-D-aspartate/D-glutamate deacylase
VGVLDLFRRQPGPLSDASLSGGLLAAQLAAQPLLEIVVTDHTSEDDGRSAAADLQRIEVYQATGMIMGQLGVSASEALVRLRGHAFATGQTASEVASAVVERRLVLEPDDWPGDARRSVSP